MKTMRIAVIATLVAFALATAANADGFKPNPKKVTNITIDKALQNPQLVVAMYAQLDPSFLDNVQHLYVVKVVYNNTIFNILGSRQSWISFFKLKWRYQKDTGHEVSNKN